ncbi:MAG: BppU family phage baseplate upper protein [Eggerthellaceae bacterium]|nr:BppU family phage baseplate upper protein [Eggerthellaceae bacterium]
MNVQTLNLDVSKRPAVTPVVYLGQGDKNGTTLAVSVYDNGVAMDLTGLGARFCMRLPGGEYYYSVAGDVSGNVATFDIDESYAAAVAGRTDMAYVEVLDGDDVICSTNRIAVVVLDGAREGVDPGEQHISEINEAVSRANEAAAGAAEVEAAIEAAEALRVAAENARAAAEAMRASAESGRASAEGARAIAETARASAESSRASAETSRANAESLRASAEAGRANAESARVSAEAARASAEADRVLEFASMEQRSRGWLKYYCAVGEYDAATRKPTVQSPDDGTLYYVPEANPTADDQWVEWEWDRPNSRWERHGVTEASITPMTTAQMNAIMDDDQTVTSTNVVNTTVWSALWTKLKTKFAAIAHTHSASNITSGTLAVARGGTGKSAVPSMLADLASENAVSPYDATPRPGVTGLLPVAHGGTGASTAAAARTNLDAAQSENAAGSLYDAEQAIADNAAAIATLGESVSLVKDRSITFGVINSAGTLSFSGNMALVVGGNRSDRSFVAFFYPSQALLIVNNDNVVTLGVNDGNYTIQNNLTSGGLRYIMVK